MLVISCFCCLDDIDNGIHVANVDFTVIVHVGSCSIAISSQDDVNDSIDISEIDIAIAVHVTNQDRFRLHLHNLPEIGIPATVCFVSIGCSVRHMKRATRIVIITLFYIE